MIIQIEPWIDDEELDQLKRVVKNTFVTEYELTNEFECLIKELTGSKYAVAITNGTMALYCSLKSLGIGVGDDVIVPDMTFIASSNSILMAGANPVICDIDNKTLCIDPNKIEELITPSTKAIMPVHLYGQSADMDAILHIARKHNLKVIEDAAQGVGVSFNGKHVGSFGDMGILSFYGNKTITCGEGGVVLTDSKDLRDKVYKLKNHGRLKKGTFTHESVGFNFCFTEMQAAIGISQMNKLSRIIDRKKYIHERYHKELKPISHVLKPIEVDPRTEPVWWFTSFLTQRKNELKSFLADNKIQTRDFFLPLHAQPCYNDIIPDKNFQVSEKIFAEGISLPSSYHLTKEDQDYIIKTIIKFYTKVEND
jgi:perosamine synthetase